MVYAMFYDYWAGLMASGFRFVGVIGK